MRRAVSLLFLCIGGFCLASLSLFAFIDGAASGEGLSLVVDFAPYILAPIGLGAWISPGDRMREVGIVLLAAAGLVALPMATIALPGAESDLPQARTIFAGSGFGSLYLALLAGAGWTLLRKGRFWELR